MEIIDGETGEVIAQEKVEESYTREGRRVIGKEFPNPIPMEPPIGYVPYEPIHEQIRRMVLAEAHRQRQEEAGEELDNEEEADDFDVGDDFDPSTPYEENHEPTDPWPMSRAARELEQAIHERRSQGRIDLLRQELEALQNGQPWPPVKLDDKPPGGAGGETPPSV